MDWLVLPDRRRLLVAQSMFAVVLSIVSGAALTFQTASPLGKFGALELVPRVTMLAIVRAYAPGTSTSAFLLALIVWSHKSSPTTVHSNLKRATLNAVLAALPLLAVTTVMAAATSIAVARLYYAVEWSAIRAGIGILRVDDFTAQLGAYATDAALLGIVSWFAIPRLTRSNWSLAGKIGACWLASTTLRIAIDVLMP